MADRITKYNIGTQNTIHKVIQTGLGASSLRSIDVNSGGTIYGVDTSRDVIYKVFEDGRMLGVLEGHVDAAGNVQDRGLSGTDGQVGRLSAPVGLCVDAAGNIFFGDQTSTLIKKLNASGRCINFAGTAAAGDAVDNNGANVAFRGSGLGLAVDAAGTLYVADTGNHKIKKIYDGGKAVVLAGGNNSNSGTANGNGQTARFSSPQDLCVDKGGFVWVADTGNNRIRLIDPNGTVITIAGGASGSTDGSGNAAKFNSPRRICIATDGMSAFVLDHGNSAIRLVDRDGNVNTFCHYNPTTTGTGDVACDKSGFLYVLENSF
jgi:DNA-binding beta-propeller fold protein YncE